MGRNASSFKEKPKEIYNNLLIFLCLDLICSIVH